MNKDEELRSFLREMGGKYHPGPVVNAFRALTAQAAGTGFAPLISATHAESLLGGMRMEETAEMLKAVNEQVLESRKILQNLNNEINAITDIVHPALMKQTREIRETRMSLVAELNQCLTALRDVRKFFFDHDYEKETERMTKFVSLVAEMKRLKDDGTLDAICDSAIRLAVKGEK